MTPPFIQRRKATSRIKIKIASYKFVSNRKKGVISLFLLTSSLSQPLRNPFFKICCIRRDQRQPITSRAPHTTRHVPVRFVKAFPFSFRIVAIVISTAVRPPYPALLRLSRTRSLGSASSPAQRQLRPRSRRSVEQTAAGNNTYILKLGCFVLASPYGMYPLFFSRSRFFQRRTTATKGRLECLYLSM